MRKFFPIVATLLSPLIFVATGYSQAGASGAASKLVIYSNLEESVRSPVVKAFERANPSMAVEIVEIAAPVALARAKSEAKSPDHAAASVWWGADDVTLESAGREGLLASSEPAWAKTLNLQFKDDKNLWNGQFLQSFSITFRRGAKDVPEKFIDLANPTYRGRLVSARPSGVNAAALFLGEILVSRGAGTAGGVERAFDWIWMLDANRGDAFVNNENEAMDKLISPDAEVSNSDITIISASAAARARDVGGKAIDFTIPTDAVAYVNGIAKFSFAPAPEAADRFIEFAGRDEHLAHYVRQGLLPLPFDRVDAASVPKWMQLAAERSRVGDRIVISQELASWIINFESRSAAGAPLLPSEETGVWWMGVVDVIGTLSILAVLILLVRRGNWSAKETPAAPGEKVSS